MLSRKSWSLEAMLKLGIWIFSSMFMGLMLISGSRSLFGKLPPDLDRAMAIVVGSLSFHGAAMVFIGLFLKQQGVGWFRAYGFKGPRMIQSVCVGLFIGTLMLPVTMILGEVSRVLMQSVHWEPEAQQTVQALQSGMPLAIKIFFGFVAIVLAPLAEEMVFRGILYPFLKQAGFRKAALWGTSILFGLFHANAMTFLPLTVFALVLTHLYETTDNLLTPIATHSLFNAANFIMLMTLTGGS